MLFFVALVVTRLHRRLDLSCGAFTQSLRPLQMELVVMDVPVQHVAHRSKAEMSEQFLLLDSGENIVIALALVQPCMAQALRTLG